MDHNNEVKFVRHSYRDGEKKSWSIIRCTQEDDEKRCWALMRCSHGNGEKRCWAKVQVKGGDDYHNEKDDVGDGLDVASKFLESLDGRDLRSYNTT